MPFHFTFNFSNLAFFLSKLNFYSNTPFLTGTHFNSLVVALGLYFPLKEFQLTTVLFFHLVLWTQAQMRKSKYSWQPRTLTLEQHDFEMHRLTSQNSLNSKYYTIGSWLNQQMQNHSMYRKNHTVYTESDYKLSVDFQLHGGWALLIPTLLKGQLLLKKSSSFQYEDL